MTSKGRIEQRIPLGKVLKKGFLGLTAMEDREEQPSKALKPIFLTLEGRMKSSMPEQPKNALYPISRIEAGRMIDRMWVFPEKAMGAMEVTWNLAIPFMTCSGTTTQVSKSSQPETEISPLMQPEVEKISPEEEKAKEISSDEPGAKVSE